MVTRSNKAAHLLDLKTFPKFKMARVDEVEKNLHETKRRQGVTEATLADDSTRKAHG